MELGFLIYGIGGFLCFYSIPDFQEEIFFLNCCEIMVFSVQNCNLLFMGMIDVESRVESVILVWSDTNLV